MAAEPEVIHQDIEETRSALTEKLEALEETIQDTVQSAKETVEETIENVTESVQETVEGVKKTFDVQYQMQQRPWTLMAGSVLAGFLVGAVLVRQRRRYYEEREGREGGGNGFYPHDASSGGGIDTRGQASSWTQPSSSPPPPPPARPEEHRPSLLQGLTSTFGDELNMVKEMAIGYGVGLVRDMVKDALPVLAEKIEKVMDSATHKMGGEPVKGPVMGEQHPEQGPQRHETSYRAC